MILCAEVLSIQVNRYSTISRSCGIWVFVLAPDVIKTRSQRQSQSIHIFPPPIWLVSKAKLFLTDETDMIMHRYGMASKEIQLSSVCWEAFLQCDQIG